jgi:hypothetical protein
MPVAAATAPPPPAPKAAATVDVSNMSTAEKIALAREQGAFKG